jgi:hypothetical protein
MQCHAGAASVPSPRLTSSDRLTPDVQTHSPLQLLRGRQAHLSRMGKEGGRSVHAARHALRTFNMAAMRPHVWTVCVRRRPVLMWVRVASSSAGHPSAAASTSTSTSTSSSSSAAPTGTPGSEARRLPRFAEVKPLLELARPQGRLIAGVCAVCVCALGGWVRSPYLTWRECACADGDRCRVPGSAGGELSSVAIDTVGHGPRDRCGHPGRQRAPCGAPRRRRHRRLCRCRRRRVCPNRADQGASVRATMGRLASACAYACLCTCAHAVAASAYARIGSWTWG